jgi:2-oxoisovalerate dehydrogenase E1 component
MPQQDAPLTDRAPAIPGFKRDSHGRPVIPLAPESLYAYGHLIRSTEQLILDQFSRGLVSGTTHTCLGQELCAMAVVRALTHPEDAALSNHRNHGHFMTYSGDFTGLVAEIMGRAAGVCGGRGGSQHLVWRHFHSNGVQGGMTGIGAGLALARKLNGSGAIVAAMIGDGTLGQGLLYEAMNLASVWGTPLLIVVENNGIAQTSYPIHNLGGDIQARGAAFGLATWRVSDDAPGFFEQVEAAVKTVRESRRPGFLVIDTRRMGPHSKGDDLRDPEEMAAIRARDPLVAMGRTLSDETRVAIEARNAAFIDTVREAADASPEALYDEAPEHIFDRASGASERPSYPDVPAGASVRLALNTAMDHLLRQHPETLLIGEDLHDPYGGAFKVTQGLSSAYPGRVISTPISEAGITGAAIGLAMDGWRPIVEIMFADFLSLCMDQLYNHAVKFPGVFPEVSVPLIVRTPSGGRRGYGPTHSQCPENIFTSIPGLTVLFGSHRHDMARLLVDAARRWLYPTLFLEHKLLYGEVQDAADYEVLEADEDDLAAHLFPTLVRRAHGADLAIVTYGGMLPVVEKAVQRLEREEDLMVAIIVPSLLSPLPRRTVLAQLMQHERVVIAEESHHEFGVGAEIAACLLEAGYTGRAVRVGTPPVPIASARSMERQILPDVERLVDAILENFYG